MADRASLIAVRIEDLLIAVAAPDRHEDSSERKAAWDEIKRRDAMRHPYETEAELLQVIQTLNDEFDALAADALHLLDQHISDEVRKETHLRIIERVDARETTS